MSNPKDKPKIEIGDDLGLHEQMQPTDIPKYDDDDDEGG
jgi:hypothetical protein|tara:strand:+ start:3818 stop:3934 length:117 start_codon:yes stop_codon:yes gene_type:complete